MPNKRTENNEFALENASDSMIFGQHAQEASSKSLRKHAKKIKKILQEFQAYMNN